VVITAGENQKYVYGKLKKIQTGFIMVEEKPNGIPFTRRQSIDRLWRSRIKKAQNVVFDIGFKNAIINIRSKFGTDVKTVMHPDRTGLRNKVS